MNPRPGAPPPTWATHLSSLTAIKQAQSRSTGPCSDKGDGDPNQDPDPPATP